MIKIVIKTIRFKLAGPLDTNQFGGFVTLIYYQPIFQPKMIWPRL